MKDNVPLKFRCLQGLGILTFMFWILGILPYLLRIIGINYLQAPELFVPLPVWSHWLIGGIIVLPFAIILTAFSTASFPPTENVGTSILMLFSGPFAIFMTGFGVNSTLGVVVPMVHTVIFGEAGEIDYKVTDLYASSSRQACHYGITVKTQVWGYSELCGFEYESRNNIRQGSTIRVSGKASRAGVFYNSYYVVQ